MWFNEQKIPHSPFSTLESILPGVRYNYRIAQGNADCLSRNPLPNAEELEEDCCFIVRAIASPVLTEEEDETLAEKQEACRNWNQLILKLYNIKT